MLKLKITPINIEPSTSVKGITKNISDSVAFMLSTANDINRVIGEVNEAFASLGESNNGDELNDRFELISKSLVEISKSIKPSYDDSALLKRVIELENKEYPAYDDSALIDRVEAIESKEQPAYDDSALIDATNELSISTLKLSNELEEVKKLQLSNKKEIDSNRKNAGQQIDEIRQQNHRDKAAK